MSKKDCAFQYATLSNVFEDTDLITLEEAKALWRKYLPDLIFRLQAVENPEMVIWVEMKDQVDYHKPLVFADSQTQTDGKEIWNLKREYLHV